MVPRALLLCLAVLCLASGANAVSLTITPNKSAYQVGETITLDVFGDAMGELDVTIQGRVLFDPGLAMFVSASQDPLTWTVGDITLPWLLATLRGGSGFADAFAQLSPVSNPAPTDIPLTAKVTLLATTPGVLNYDWDTDSNEQLRFFGLTDAPGGTVTIVPEPATALLMALGFVMVSAGRRPRKGPALTPHIHR